MAGIPRSRAASPGRPAITLARAVAMLVLLYGPGGLARAQESTWSRVGRGIGSVWTTITEPVGSGLTKLSDWVNPGCPYKPDGELAGSVESVLRRRIVGQDAALETLIGAVKAWQATREAEHRNPPKHSGVSQRYPLVAALMGTTGVGKTETSNALGEGLFPPFPASLQRAPGYLLLQGDSYSVIDEDTSLSDLRARLRRRVARHVHGCKGTALVVIDEAQQILPQVLNVLEPALAGTGAHLMLTAAEEAGTAGGGGGGGEGGNGGGGGGASGGRGDDDSDEIVVDTSDVVFLFISDFGSEGIVKLLRRAAAINARLSEKQQKQQKQPQAAAAGQSGGSGGTAIPLPVLSQAVRDELDGRWANVTIRKHVRTVVPYLPMSRGPIMAVVDLRLAMTRDVFAGVFWRDLSWSKLAVAYLASSRFIAYTSLGATATDSGAAGGAADAAGASAGSGTKFAVAGARAVHDMSTGPLFTLKDQLRRVLSPPDAAANVSLDVTGPARAPLFQIKVCRPRPCPAAAAIGDGSGKDGVASVAVDVDADSTTGHQGGLVAADAGAGVQPAQACEPTLLPPVCGVAWEGDLLEAVHASVTAAGTLKRPARAS